MARANRPVAARTITDATVISALLATIGTPEGLYGRRKMTHWLRRQGLEVAFCTVDRLMGDLGMSGVRRGKGVRTTIPAKDGHRAGDLLNRDFTAPAPNTRWVADFTYCRTWAGFVYVAFVVDVFSQRIVAWQAATDRRTDLVLTPLRIALWDRGRQGHPVEPGQLLHHSDAGSQGGFNWSSQHLDRGGVQMVRRQQAADRAIAARRCGRLVHPKFQRRGRGGVLGRDRQGLAARGGGRRGRRGASRSGSGGSATLAACRRST